MTMDMRYLFVAASALLMAGAHLGENVSRVCYYVLTEDGLAPEGIDPTLCSHINCAFAVVRNGTLVPNSPGDIESYHKTIALKKAVPSLKVMLSVGGGGKSANFSEMVKTPAARNRFADEAVQFLLHFGFDGIDFDWEFPAWNGDPPQNRYNFIFLLQAMSIRLRKEDLLLSVAVAAVLPIIDDSYNIPKMARYVDFVNLMSYDFHLYQKFLPFTGHNSPLFARPNETFQTLNTVWSTRCWEQRGMPKSKIMVGIPTYGHTFHLLREDRNGLDAPCTGPGFGGGWIEYPQVCTFLQSGAIRVYDNQSFVPFCYLKSDWISYDDTMSVVAKAKWVASNGYKGVMTFSLNSDDWDAKCDNKTHFPLHSALKRALT